MARFCRVNHAHVTTSSETLTLAANGHAGIMHVDQPPPVRRPSVNLGFTAVSRNRRTIFAESGSEIPIEFGFGRVAKHLNCNVVGAQLPLREHAGHETLVNVLLDLFKAMFVS